MAHHSKVNKIESQKRVNIVYEMLLSGYRRGQIHQFVTNPPFSWEIGVRQIDHIISEAMKIAYESLKKDRDMLADKIYARYEFLYTKFIKAKDYKSAAVINEKMLVFLPKQTVEATDADNINPVREINIAVFNTRNSHIQEAEVLPEEVQERDVIQSKLIK